MYTRWVKPLIRRVVPSSVRAWVRSGGHSPPGRSVKPKNFHESDIILRYFRRVPREGMMLDVGARFGACSEPYLAMDWQVWAFEPDPGNRQILMDRLSSSRMKCLPIAISDQDADNAAFYSSDETSAISTLRAFRSSHKEVAKVPVRRLSTIVQEEGIDRVDYLKVDAEGFDLLVLRGFPWEDLRPEVILCEFEDRKTLPLGYDVDDLGQFLLSQDYDVFLSEWEPIVRYGGGHTWRDIATYPCRLYDRNGWGNFIAIDRQTDTSVLREEIDRSREACRS